MKVLADQMPGEFHGLRDWYGLCSFATRLLLATDVEMGLSSSAARSLDGQSFLSLSAARFYSGLLAPPSPLPSCPVMYLVDVFNLPLGKLPALETAA
jgi:hypothetical protein